MVICNICLKNIESEWWQMSSDIIVAIISAVGKIIADLLTVIIPKLEKNTQPVAAPKPPAVDEEIETSAQMAEPVEKTPVTESEPSLGGKGQKSDKRGILRSVVMVTVILLCGMIAIRSFISNASRYEVSSPESRDLIQWEVVEHTLCDRDLEKTAMPLSVYDPSLNNWGHLYSNKIHSISYPFTVQCAQLPVNPISAFIAIGKDYFDRATTSFYIDISDWEEMEYIDLWRSFFDKMPYDLVKKWEWSESGVKAFIGDMLALTSKFGGGFDLDERFLSMIHSNEETAVHYSSEEQCYYTYFIYYGDCTSHLVCMYFRADQETGTRITDVEFQFLNMDYTVKGGLGFSISARELINTNREQMLALIVSAEYLLTGSSGMGEAICDWDGFDNEFVVPAEYRVEDYRVIIKHSTYYASTRYDVIDDPSDESCELVTYRIHRIKS